KALYIHGPGIDEPLAMFRSGVGGGLFTFHADGLGSITTLTDATGTPVRTYTYDSFGRIVAETGTVSNPFTFTAREFDPETGLFYYRARYYDQRIGRFIQVDPLLRMKDVPAEMSPNLRILPPYTYVENSPLNGTDPLGLYTFSIGITLSASAFGAGGGGGTFINIGHNPNTGWLSGWSFSITGTAEGGAIAGVGGGPGITFTVTNACNVGQLLGSFFSAGRSGLGRTGIGYFQSPNGVVKGVSFTATIAQRGYLGAGIGGGITSAIVQWVQDEGFSFGVTPEGALFP
ncbi:MAG: RHS repeat-associated core domain-containing protein, partial [Candidatus Binatia bacterium]